MSMSFSKILEVKMMVVKKASEVTKQDVKEARGVTVQWLIDSETGAENFAMRKFTLERGGYTPLHAHDWEHEVYVLSGKGIVTIGDNDFTLEEEKVAHVPPNISHQFRNIGNEDFIFLCIIPLKGGK